MPLDPGYQLMSTEEISGMINDAITNFAPVGGGSSSSLIIPPTSDPGVAGALWVSNFTIIVSKGPPPVFVSALPTLTPNQEYYGLLGTLTFPNSAVQANNVSLYASPSPSGGNTINTSITGSDGVFQVNADLYASCVVSGNGVTLNVNDNLDGINATFTIPFTIGLGAPLQPATNLTAQNISNRGCTLYWNAATGGTAPITYYPWTSFGNPAFGPTYTSLYGLNTTGLNQNVTGFLTTAGTYQIEIVAIDANNEQATSASIIVVIPS